MSNDTIKNLTNALSELTIISDGSVELDEGAFWSNAPEEVTPEVVTAVRQYESDYIVSSAKALGSAAETYLKDNPDADLVSGTFHMGPGVEVNHSLHKNAEDGEWSMVSGVERTLTGEELLSGAQAEISRMLVG